MSASSSQRRVTFADSDVVVFLPPDIPSEVSETERPQTPTGPSSSRYSPTSTSTLSTSDPYTPPSNSEYDISIESQDVDITNFDSLGPIPPDAVAPEAKALDSFLHPRLSISNPVHWSMLINPQSPLRPDELDELGQEFMMRNAFADPISNIRFNCDILPWPIIINIGQDDLNRRSPRIDDIVNSIYASIWKLASFVDLDRQTMERQRRIRRAYLRRCRQLSISKETDGLRRIDFLEGQTMFLGLSRGNHDDEWHLHVGQE